MKLRTQLSILHPEAVVRLLDADKLDLVAKVKDIPKDLKERSVKKLHKSFFDNAYDLTIYLKV